MIRRTELWPAEFPGGKTSANEAEPAAPDPVAAEVAEIMDARMASVQVFGLGEVQANHYLLGLIAILIVAGIWQQRAGG